MDASRILGGSETDPAAGFSALGDPARLAILGALGGGTRCVCELVPRLGLAQNLLSYHLRILREAGLVRGSRRGRRIEYTIEAAGVEALREALALLSPAVDGALR
ncbi:MAG: ArsR/SmtB family transcription factor [Actinomycetota bacterium]